MTRLSSVLRRALQQLLPLVLLGVAVGLACWPLNLLDRAQDQLLQRLPAFGGQWTVVTVLMALAPVLVMPLLLWLQAGTWREGSGSGIPQTMAVVEDPARSEALLSPRPTLQRLVLWSLATLALFPLGREGPVVQVGAAVTQALRRRWPRLLQGLSSADAVAVAGAAGLAGGFNTPFMGVVFLAEELTGRFGAGLIWPGLLVCVCAAGISNLGGQGEFALGMLRGMPPEPLQLLWAVPLGIAAGLLGGLFARLIVMATARLTPLARRRPLRTGLMLGVALVLLLLLSGGSGGGDGETLMHQLIEDPQVLHAPWIQLPVRLIGPALALGVSVPGGLIDPALALGAVLGQVLSVPLDLGALGMALGMAAALAGATQLPAMSLVFVMRLGGDQQFLPGLLMAAVLGAYSGRLLLRRPVYHALAELLAERHS
jgi:H+/Cl- antiporter ClcA